MNSAYFEWNYERNPYLSAPLIYVALHEGEAIGMRGFFCSRWEAGVPPEASTALFADDLVIAPEHRNRGLIAKIMTSAFRDLAGRGFEYVFNLSASPVTFVASLSTGWRSIGSMQPWRRGSRNSSLSNTSFQRMTGSVPRVTPTTPNWFSTLRSRKSWRGEIRPVRAWR